MENKVVKVKYIGEKSDWLVFMQGKVYDKIGESHGLWRVIDETGEDYLYDPDVFEVLTDEQYEELMKTPDFQPHKCPICGKTEFPWKNSGKMCVVCKWFDFDDPAWNKGMTVEEYKREYTK